MSSLSNRRKSGIGEVVHLVSSWWYHYDQWCPDTLRTLIADDFRFSCRSDTGSTTYEDFIRCDIIGADSVMEWQEEHRMASPYPLRHNSSNVVITSNLNGAIEFSSYIHVTKIVEGRPHPLSSGIVHGLARESEDSLLLAGVEVVLDTADSIVYSSLPKTGH